MSKSVLVTRSPCFSRSLLAQLLQQKVKSVDGKEEVPMVIYHSEEQHEDSGLPDVTHVRPEVQTNSRNPRPFDTIEGGRVYQALHIDSKSVLDALCRVKKCLRRSM